MAASHTGPLGQLLSRKLWLIIAALAVLVTAAASPAIAHTDHKKKKAAEAAQLVQPASPHGTPAAIARVAPPPMGDMMADMARDRAKMTTAERLMDWLGRLHPMVVHFPMAFFPAALFTAIVGRRRPGFGKPVQFLVVAGGILAPIAALLGWFTGGFEFATDDALLAPHRWLGTAIGVGALGLGLWAWRQPEEDRGPGMITGLAIITTAIVVQGWYGGALVHGMDHMNW